MRPTLFAFCDVAGEHLLARDGSFLPLGEAVFGRMLTISDRREAEAVAALLCSLGCHVRPYDLTAGSA